MTEYFDIVDHCDRVIGKDTRFNVHKYGKLHRAVHVFIRNTDNQYFIQQRSATKDVSPLCWGSSVSGHVDAGEDYDTAAIRETLEEVGIQLRLEDLAFLFKSSAREETGMEFVQVYETSHDSKLNYNKEEIVDGCWKTEDEIHQWVRKKPEDFTRSFRYLWSKYCLLKEDKDAN